MGYNATSRLVYGFQLTPTEEARISSDQQDVYYARNIGDVGLHYSGDGRGDMEKPVLGILVADGSDWEPELITLSPQTEEQVLEVKRIADELGLGYQKPSLFLVSSIN